MALFDLVPARPRGPRAGGSKAVGDSPVEVVAHRARVAVAHDYITQPGGAERVVLDIVAAFPDAPIYTTLFHPSGTFPEFGGFRPTTSALNRLGPLRRHHRFALPLLAPAVSRMMIDADISVVSTSGWAHGIPTTGKKIVYCHAPARWLYQTQTYLGDPASHPGVAARARYFAASKALIALAGPLRHWDQKAAATADVYLANSTITQQAISHAYGIDAEVLPPAPALRPEGDEEQSEGIEPGYFLCVARLLPYKNVDAVIKAVHKVKDARLVIVGAGPDEDRLTDLVDSLAGPGQDHRIFLAGRVSDERLRWLYRNSIALVAASIEDYGLTPLEGAAFGKPTVALAAGGYLDTVVDGRTGVLFPTLDANEMAQALTSCLDKQWDTATLVAHADAFGAGRFRARLQEIVTEVLRR